MIKKNIDEGMKEVFISLASFIEILCYGGSIDATKVTEQLNSYPNKVITLNQIDNAIKTNDNSKDVGRFTRNQAINIVARTLWMEMRGLGKKAILSCASIIWNRSNNSSDIVEKCIKSGKNKKGINVYQFAVWKDFNAKNFTKNNYQIREGKNLINQHGNIEEVDMEIWKFCVNTATSMIDGTFIPKHDYNLYKNIELDSEISKKTWGITCNSRVDGDNIHWYGHDPSQDGKLSNTKKNANKKDKIVSTYTVVAKDNPSTIAKKHGMTVKEFNDLNPNINPLTLSIGQKVKVKIDKPDSYKDSISTYTVIKNDNPYLIAKKHGMTVKEFNDLNPNINPLTLSIGQKVKVINHIKK